MSEKILFWEEKKAYTYKSQRVVDKRSKKILCTAFAHGKKHDFRLFKESHTFIHPKTNLLADTGYTGILKIHSHSEIPQKKTFIPKQHKPFHHEFSKI